MVVILAAGHIFYGEAGADLDAFDSADAEHSAQFGVELVEDRLAEACGDTGYDDFNYAAG
ncbi:hypothetical protein ES703_79022 [subsurface metagenome]